MSRPLSDMHSIKLSFLSSHSNATKVDHTFKIRLWTHCSNLWLLLLLLKITCLLFGFPERLCLHLVSHSARCSQRRARKLRTDNYNLKTEQYRQNYGHWLKKQVHDAPTKTYEHLKCWRNQGSTKKKIPSIHRPNRLVQWNPDFSNPRWW